MLPAAFAIIGSVIAAYAAASALFDPGLKALQRQAKSKEDAARFLVEALDYEAENGKIKDAVRKLPVKPGGNVIAYYQLKTGKSLSFVAVYASGNIGMKAAERTDWEWYTSPDALNRLYAYFSGKFNESIKGIEPAHLKAEDVAVAAKSAVKLPGAVSGLKN